MAVRNELAYTKLKGCLSLSNKNRKAKQCNMRARERIAERKIEIGFCRFFIILQNGGSREEESEGGTLRCWGLDVSGDAFDGCRAATLAT
ncbi:hypothetical protein PIB30_087518, partial [Stylosanthes scabra]|nr:hypothetical protein [Stylosanthes scabra]